MSSLFFKWCFRCRDWINVEDYPCEECQTYRARSYNSLQMHLKTIHKMSGSEYRAKYGLSKGDTNETNKVHCCKICRRIIAFTPMKMRYHMKHHHNGLILKDYYRDHIAGTTDDVTISKDELRKSHDEYVKAKEWAMNPKMSCVLCMPHDQDHHYQEFESKSELEAHLFTHNLAFADFVSAMNSATNYTCRICKKLLSWTFTSFWDHMTSQHEMTWTEYFSKHVVNRSSPSSTGESGAVKTAISSEAVPINELNLKANSQDSKEGEELPVKNENLVNCDTNEESDYWTDGCLFKCDNCEDVPRFLSKGAFVNHLNEDHDKKLPTYKAYSSEQPKIPISEVTLISCQICQKILIREKEVISLHLKSSHSMNPTSYAKKFSDHLGITLF